MMDYSTVLLTMYSLVTVVTGANINAEVMVTADSEAILPCEISKKVDDFFYRSWKRGYFPNATSTNLFRQVGGSEPERFKDIPTYMELDKSTFSLMIGTAQPEDQSVYTCYVYSTTHPSYHYSYVYLNVDAKDLPEKWPFFVILIVASGALVVGLGLVVIVFGVYKRQKEKRTQDPLRDLMIIDEGQYTDMVYQKKRRCV